MSLCAPLGFSPNYRKDLMKIEDLIAVLQRAKDAEDILGKVWAFTDPYSGQIRDEMSKEIRDDLRRHFKFDDSE